MKDVDMNQIRSATITYVTKPTDNQLAGIKKFIADQLDVNVDELDINLVQDSSIGSGFVVRAGNHEYDWSEKARIEQLSEKLKSGLKDGLDPENMLSNLQSELENFTLNRADR